MDTANIVPGRRKRTSPIPEDLRAGLAALVSSIGEAEARKRCCLSKQTFARCVAGFDVSSGSTALVRLALQNPGGQS